MLANYTFGDTPAARKLARVMADADQSDIKKVQRYISRKREIVNTLGIKPCCTESVVEYLFQTMHGRLKTDVVAVTENHHLINALIKNIVIGDLRRWYVSVIAEIKKYNMPTPGTMVHRTIFDKPICLKSGDTFEFTHRLHISDLDIIPEQTETRIYNI